MAVADNVGGSYNFKVVLLGEGCVGKTSCVLRYVEDKFNERHVTTLQAAFLNKRINLNGKRVNLSLWDTAGQERFHALAPIYYRDADGAVLVYDITEEDSFSKVKNWVRELKRMLGTDSPSVVICGNKNDLEERRRIDTEAAEEYAESVGAKHFETSAKLNCGIEELFLDLTQRMIAKADIKAKNSKRNKNSHRSGNNITIVNDDLLQAPKSSGCCSFGGGGFMPEVSDGQPLPTT